MRFLGKMGRFVAGFEVLRLRDNQCSQSVWRAVAVFFALLHIGFVHAALLLITILLVNVRADIDADVTIGVVET